MTSYYLVDNPNRYAAQFSPYRNGRLSGGVLLHTTESPKDRGAAPIAHWIATQRKDYGSYHAIFDASTTILMAPDTATVWHCASPGYNSTTMGVSWACRTSDLHPDDDWTRRAFAQAARWLVDFWTRNGINPASANHFIPAGDTRNRPGLSTHGDAQPADRSDAFTRHPQRAGLEALLRSQIAAHTASQPNPSIPVPPGVDATVNQPTMMQEPNGTVWIFYGGTPWRVHVKSPADVNAFRYMGVPYQVVDANQAAFFRRYSQEVKCA